MCKNLVLMKEVICKYHPKFTTNKSIRTLGISNPMMFNVERLTEESLAFIGGYDFVDAVGYDFNDEDFSDSKTVSIQQKTRQIIISNVETKIGSLRVIVYNPFNEKLDFLYLPKGAVSRYKTRCWGKQREKQRIQAVWSTDGHYNQLERFRLSSFEELATVSDKKINEHNSETWFSDFDSWDQFLETII